MECSLTPGMRVVCIHGYPPIQPMGVAVPEKNHTYTVREVLMCSFMEGLLPAVRLVEVVNPLLLCRGYGGVVSRKEPCWYHAYFPPLVGRPTSIEVFQRLRREVSPTLGLVRDDA